MEASAAGRMPSVQGPDDIINQEAGIFFVGSDGLPNCDRNQVRQFVKIA
jgi:hypothetical protein